MKIPQVIILQEGADLDALSSSLAFQKLSPHSVLLKPRFLSKRASQVFSQFSHLFRLTERVPEKFILVLLDTNHIPEEVNLLNVEDVIIYDHHPPKENFSFKGKIDKTGSATTLVVEELIKRKQTLTKEEATVIALGIYEDTGCFTYGGTTPRDLKAAGWLLERGADLKLIRRFIQESYTKNQIEAVEKLLSSLEKIYLDGLTVVIATAVLSEYEPDINTLLYEVKDLKEADAFFVIIEAGSKTYVFGRSQCKEINAGEILSTLGGGGHPEAGSLKLENVPAQRIKNFILGVLKGKKTSGHRVGDIMTSPPFCLKENLTVKEALKELTARGFANAPVVDHRDRLIGIVSKKALLKVADQFGDRKVGEFANRDVHVLSTEDPVWSAEEVLTRFGQKMIPVIDKGKLVGILTRIDLLHKIKEDLGDLIAHSKKIKIEEPVLSIAKEVGEIASSIGARGYLVGGVVRDLLMGRKVWDLDFVVEGSALEVARKVAEKHSVQCHTFEEFGTAHLKIGELKLEFATTRRETYPSPGSYPIVEPSSLKEDLIRRDFTINAMAISVNPEDFGTLIDYFGGYRDIKERLIRVIHPVSFIEDPVRILRALRFAGRLGFKLSKNTSNLLKQAVSAGMLRKAPRGRITAEIRLALREERILEILWLYRKYRVLEEIIKGFQWKENLVQVLEELKKITDWHSLEFSEEKLDYGWLFLMVILSSVKKETATEFLRDVSAPSWVRENLSHLYRIDPLKERLKKSSRPSDIYEVLKGLHTGVLLLLMTDKEIREKVKLYLEKLRRVKIEEGEIKKLKEKGLRGKELGREVERLKREKMDRAFSVIMERS
jgi:tRNA nucleotidyltransferase (CCA-adding enzyme)